MMLRNIAAASGIALIFALSIGVAGCAPSAPASNAGDQQSSTLSIDAKGDSVSLEQAREVLMSAKDTPYSSLTFDVSTESTATAISNGETQQQSMTTSMKGELDKSGETEKAHIAYASTSTTELGKITYEMYLDGDAVIVEQNGVLFTDAAEGTAESYRNSVVSAMNEEDLNQILDMGASCKIDKTDGKTTVTITADPKKIAESDFIDTESLPEGSSIATLVASYTIDSNNRFETIRVMSSTTGTPTYRVNETYRYSNYDSTELPAWPDIRAYALEQMGIHVAEDGTMTFADDDGTVYTIDSIDEDGTIHYSIGGESGEFSILSPVTEEGESQTVVTTETQPEQTTSSNANASSGSSPTPADPAAFTEGSSTKQSGASFSEGATSTTPTDATAFNEGAAPSTTDTSTATTDTSTSTNTDSANTGTTDTSTTNTGTTDAGTSTSQTDSTTPTDTTPTTTDTTTNNTTSEQGRAYITGDDGAIHYLDEEGSRLITNSNGTRYFIDANGNFYFLQG